MARVSNYDIAKAVVLTMAELGGAFAPAGYYDDDADMVETIAELSGIGKVYGKGFRPRLFRVCNQLCHIGVLYGFTSCTHKEYIGEPTRQRDFRITNPSTAWRLFPPDDVKKHYMSQENELAFLLRHFPGAPKRED